MVRSGSANDYLRHQYPLSGDLVCSAVADPQQSLFQPYLNLLDERERKTTGAQHDSAELEHEGARLSAQYEEKIARAQSAAAAKESASCKAVANSGKQF